MVDGRPFVVGAELRAPHAQAAAGLAEAVALADPGPGRIQLLLELSDAAWRAGDLPAAVDHAWRAYDEAVGIEDRHLKARAALALAAPPETGLSDEPALRALGEAAEDVRDDPGLAAQVLARLAAALHAAGRPAAAHACMESALPSADTLPAVTRCFVLRCRQWLLSAPDDQQVRRRAADELVDTALVSGDGEQLMWAHGWRLSALLSDGDVAGAAGEAARIHRLAERLDEPFHRSCALMWDSALASLRGDLSAAEELARRAWAREVRLGFEEQMLAIQLWEPLRQQGRLPEVRPLLESLLEVDEPVWRTTVPLGRLQSGDRDGAMLLFRSLVSGVAGIPRDLYWLFGVGALAITCIELEAVSEAGPLYALLLPYETRLCDAAGIATCGPAGLLLGRLAALVGDTPAARRHLERALTWAEAAGAPAYAAVARTENLALGTAGGWSSLTPAERRVADLVAQGLTNREVAHRLALSHYTVETHLKRVFGKLELRSRTALAAEVLRRRT